MSYVAQRMVSEPLRRRVTRALPVPAELLPAVLLAGVALVLARTWWSAVRDLSVPLSRGVLDLPLVDLVYQVPGVLVVGLLFVRAVALTGHRTVATQHMSEMAARWAWLWAAASLLWLALTASRLTGVSVPALLTREDLLAVLGRSNLAGAQIATFWVALVVAFFATRLTSTLETRALVVLTAAALLPVLANVPGAGHAPDTAHPGWDLHWLAMVALAVQLLAAVVWLGVLTAMVLHLRVLPVHLRRAVVQFSHTASLCVLLIGMTALVQDALTLPTLAAVWETTSGQLILAKGVALLLLVAVGYRHRSRTAHDCGSRWLPLARLVAGELVLLGAAAAITMVINPIL